MRHLIHAVKKASHNNKANIVISTATKAIPNKKKIPPKFRWKG